MATQGDVSRLESVRLAWFLIAFVPLVCVACVSQAVESTAQVPSSKPESQPKSSQPKSAKGREYRGVALLHLTDREGAIGYGSKACQKSLEQAHAVGVRAVSLRVPGRQPSIHVPRIRFGQEPRGEETDAVVAQTIRDAHALGLRVMLKPHIMLDTITDSEWRGRIDYEDSDQLEKWWEEYRAFILNYAEFARKHRVELYCVGVELMDMVIRAPEEWRRLIRDVREVYPGELTYAANWDEEFARVPFWSDLDHVAVQFFYPLSDHPEPSLEELKTRVQEIAEQLFEVAAFARKPLLLTECGYRSVRGSTVKPWVWPKDDPDSVADAALQARVYRAVLEVFSSQPLERFSGLFWWNWLTLPDPNPGLSAKIFTPQGKPAEKVIREFWTEITNPDSK